MPLRGASAKAASRRERRASEWDAAQALEAQVKGPGAAKAWQAFQASAARGEESDASRGWRRHRPQNQLAKAGMLNFLADLGS